MPETNDAAPAARIEARGNANAIADFVRSAVYSGLEEPLSGLGQIADKISGSHVQSSIQEGFKSIGVAEPEKASFGSLDWHAQQLGSAVGMLLPYLALHRVVKAGAINLLGESTVCAGVTESKLLSGTNLLGIAGKEALLSGATGFAYDSLLRPTEDKTGSSLLSERLSNGLSGAATFGVLGGTSALLGGSAALIERSSAVSLVNNKFVVGMLRNPVSAGALSAVPAGLIGSEIDARRNDQTLSMSDRLKSVYAMSFVGGALGGSRYLSAQHEGSERTNLDYAVDRMRGISKSASPEQAEFKVVGQDSQSALDSFRQQSAADDRQAAAQIQVRQYLGKGLLGGGLFSGKGLVERLGIWGDKYGQTRSLLLNHDAQQLTSATVRDASLLASCNPQDLDASIANRHIFAGGKGSVWLNAGQKSDHIVLNLGEKPLAQSPHTDSPFEPIELGKYRQGGGRSGIIPFERAKDVLNPPSTDRTTFTSFQEYGAAQLEEQRAQLAESDPGLKGLKQAIADLYEQAREHRQKLGQARNAMQQEQEVLNARGGGSGALSAVEDFLRQENRLAELNRQQQELTALTKRYAQLSRPVSATAGDALTPGRPLPAETPADRAQKEQDLSFLRRQIEMRKGELGSSDNPKFFLEDAQSGLQHSRSLMVDRFRANQSQEAADYMDKIVHLNRTINSHQTTLDRLSVEFTDAMNDFQARHKVVRGETGSNTPEQKLLRALFGDDPESPAVVDATAKVNNELPALIQNRASIFASPELSRRAATELYRNSTAVFFNNGLIVNGDGVTGKHSGRPLLIDMPDFETKTPDLGKVSGYAIVIPETNENGRLNWKPSPRGPARIEKRVALVGGDLPAGVKPGVSLGQLYRQYALGSSR